MIILKCKAMWNTNIYLMLCCLLKKLLFLKTSLRIAYMQTPSFTKNKCMINDLWPKKLMISFHQRLTLRNSGPSYVKFFIFCIFITNSWHFYYHTLLQKGFPCRIYRRKKKIAEQKKKKQTQKPFYRQFLSNLERNGL